MRLYYNILIILCRRYLLRQNTGQVIYDFASRMGIVYIKVAQILAMQNIGQIFTESDRQMLSRICDRCNPLPFSDIEVILAQEYQQPLSEIFTSIDPIPLGSASISQVHRATLHSGETVAVKVKRPGVDKRVQRDIKQIRRLVRRFGRFAKFRNFLGSDRALECYIEWIYQETDFANECRNLELYCSYLQDLNPKISSAINFSAPRAYPDLCTNNVIVMEFIEHPTINQSELNSDTKKKISRAIDDYIRLEFYALFHGLPVIFHGDSHGGNLYLDEAGNLGFLDMGLIFEFDTDEASLIRDLFLYAYANKVDQLADLLLSKSDLRDLDRPALVADIQAEVLKFKATPVPQFFIEMIGIFTKYNVAPPTILYKGAKAFLALFGINTFSDNTTDTQTLLSSLIAEYYLERTLHDAHNVAQATTASISHLLSPKASISTSISKLAHLHHELDLALQHGRELLDLIKPNNML